MVKTYIIEGPEKDYIFWVESVPQYDNSGDVIADGPVFYQVDYDGPTKYMYAGPEHAHKDVVVDTVFRLVGKRLMPSEILDQPVKVWL